MRFLPYIRCLVTAGLLAGAGSIVAEASPSPDLATPYRQHSQTVSEALQRSDLLNAATRKNLQNEPVVAEGYPKPDRHTLMEYRTEFTCMGFIRNRACA